MKLELRHVAPYLPYGLKVKRNVRIDDKDQEPIFKMETITTDTVTWLGDFYNERKFNIEFCKPILRPLSDLTKEMARDCAYVSLEDMIRSIEAKHVSLEIYQDLLNNGYDVFGLIDKDLAVNINTIE